MPQPHGSIGSPRAVAAIDLGSNNCRLLIAAPSPPLRILNSWSRIVRLGEGVAQTGALSEAAMARTVAALEVCARRLERHAPLTLRAIATEACRQARNAPALVARVRARTGIALEIVPQQEEARLAALGCAPLLGEGFAGAIVFDIGGGSTEIIRLERAGGRIGTVFSASVPLGVVSLSEGGLDFAQARAHAMTVFAALARDMERQAGPFDAVAHHLLGTSGTVTTLAGVAAGLARYDRRRIDASWHDTAALLAVADRLVALPPADRAAIGCVGTARAELMVPGCAVFSALCAQWPAARLRVADRGLREGILRELMEAVQT